LIAWCARFAGVDRKRDRQILVKNSVEQVS
jgi:hypothetical protein